MQSLSYETEFNYLLRLPYRSVINYCLASRDTSHICRTSYFWKQKGIVDYGVETASRQEYAEIDRIMQLPARDRLLELIRTERFSLIPIAMRGEWSRSSASIHRIIETAIDMGSLAAIKAIIENMPRDMIVGGYNIQRWAWYAWGGQNVQIYEYLLQFIVKDNSTRRTIELLSTIGDDRRKMITLSYLERTFQE